jgi:hypothetical protein
MLDHFELFESEKSYNSKVDKFQDFCGRVQDEAGTPRLSSMSTSQTTILDFIGYLTSLDRIRSSSLHPYLSAINNLHADFGFKNPDQGNWISLSKNDPLDRVTNQKRCTSRVLTEFWDTIIILGVPLAKMESPLFLYLPKLTLFQNCPKLSLSLPALSLTRTVFPSLPHLLLSLTTDPLSTFLSLY